MSLINLVPKYCEHSELFFHEPINFISNTAFLIAFIFLWRDYRRINNNQLTIGSLLVLSIGLGSFLWHGTQSIIGLVLDALPIYAFALFILWNLSKNTFKYPFLIFITGVLFIISSLLLKSSVNIFNGSITHIGNWLFLALITWKLHKKQKPTRNLNLALTAYALAIISRTIDMATCDHTHYGTHFLWHVFAAATAYFTVKSLEALYPQQGKF